MNIQVTNSTYYRTADIEDYVQRLVQLVESTHESNPPWRDIRRIDVAYTSGDQAVIVHSSTGHWLRLKLPYKNKLGQSDLERLAIGTADSPVIPQSAVENVAAGLVSALLSHKWGGTISGPSLGSKIMGGNRVINRGRNVRELADKLGPIQIHIEEKSDPASVNVARLSRARDEVDRLTSQSENSTQRIDYLQRALRTEEMHRAELQKQLDDAKATVATLTKE
jgi:hypothetical protein